MLILSVFLALAMILCIFIFKNPKDKQEYNIDKKEAKILEIENKKIYDISSSISKKGVTTKIKNASLSQIVFLSQKTEKSGHNQFCNICPYLIINFARLQTIYILTASWISIVGYRWPI